MFPGNQRKCEGREPAKDLRHQDDVFSTESICQMASRQGKRTTGTAMTNPTKPSAVAEWVRA